MCHSDQYSTTPLDASSSESGTYSYTLRIKNGLGVVSACLNYTGSYAPGCIPPTSPYPALALANLTVFEDLIRATIDPDYVVPELTGMGPQTLAETQDFLNQYYTLGTPNAAFQAAVACLIIPLYLPFRNAVIRSVTTPPSFCGGTPAFLKKVEACNYSMEIRVH